MIVSEGNLIFFYYQLKESSQCVIKEGSKLIIRAKKKRKVIHKCFKSKY